MISLDVMIAYLCSITTMKKTLFWKKNVKKWSKMFFLAMK